MYCHQRSFNYVVHDQLQLHDMHRKYSIANVVHHYISLQLNTMLHSSAPCSIFMLFTLREKHKILPQYHQKSVKYNPTEGVNNELRQALVLLSLPFNHNTP